MHSRILFKVAFVALTLVVAVHASDDDSPLECDFTPGTRVNSACCRKFCSESGIFENFQQCLQECKTEGIPDLSCGATADCEEGTCCGLTNKMCTGRAASSVAAGFSCSCSEECAAPSAAQIAMGYSAECEEGTCIFVTNGACATNADCGSTPNTCCGSAMDPYNRYCTSSVPKSLPPGSKCNCDAECMDANHLEPGVCDQGSCVIVVVPTATPTTAPTGSPVDACEASLTATLTTTPCMDDASCNAGETCCNGVCSSIAPLSLADGVCCCTSTQCTGNTGNTGQVCDGFGTQCRPFCLAADSSVTIRRGSTVMRTVLSSVEQGDEIEVFDEATGGTMFDPVMLMHHFENGGDVAPVNVIEYDGGKVEITDEHLIYVSAVEDRFTRTLIGASAVTESDFIWVKQDGVVTPAKVTSISRRVTPVLNVVTRKGNYVANNVIVSSHVGTHEADHALKCTVFGWYFDVLPKLLWWKDVDFHDYEFVRVFVREVVLHPLAKLRVVRKMAAFLSTA